MVTKSAGLTMVEMAVTLAVMAMLMAAATPFTLSWVHSARISEAKSKLLQGYGLVKALAQRNPNGAHAPAPAAGLKLDGQVLLVCAGDPATSKTCVAGGGSVTWQITLPANTEITFGSEQTLGVDNTGMPLSTIRYNITNGGQSESGDFV